jgi:predicted DNA-binding transcriptional regulator AlpA
MSKVAINALMSSTASAPDAHIPDPQVAKELGITLMSLWRYTHDPALNFPPPIKIRNRNFRSRLLLEQFKQRMLRDAIAKRGGSEA